MPPVVGLLEQHERAARRRVDGLREDADRIQAELAAAEREWEEWAIARRRVDAVLTPDGDSAAGPQAGQVPREREAPSARPGLPEAAKPKSVVPVWRAGPAPSVLSVDYQRILQALADRGRLDQGTLTCQELADSFGMEMVSAKVEALRSKAKRLVARGWLAEPMPGRFTLAEGVAGPGGGP
ncbi:hypothetical protein IPZ70_19135 [Streptomyces polychromogenes]|nr:hypothetical protein [Streptomyces polychromogenes]